MHLQYLLGSLFTLPLLPLLYYQGKQVKAKVPQLPEAAGPAGRSGDASGPPLRLLVLGESTMAGVGVDTHAEGFAGILSDELAERLGAEVCWRVYARSGYTAQQVRERLVPQIEPAAADLIVVGLGANDAFALNSPRKWRRDVVALIDALQAKCPAATIAFVNMPPIKAFPAFPALLKHVVGNLVELLGAELKALVAGRAEVYFYDRVLSLQDWRERRQVMAPPEAFFSDGVHPSRLTYRLWARDVADFLSAHPAVRSRLKPGRGNIS